MYGQGESKIFGIEIPRESKKEIQQFIQSTLDGKNSAFLATLNPEILLHASKDDEYRNILNRADIRVIDGFGVKLVSWLKSCRAGERFAGPELPELIIQEANKRNLKIGLVMRIGDFSTRDEIENAVKKWNINKIFVLEPGPWKFQEPGSEIPNVHVLLVGLGAPWQEKLIWEIKDKLPNLKLAMGVGGTFDYWTGRQKRAPKWMQKIGLEWLWRLIMDPKRRIKRIWNATFVFLYKNLF